jgi:hypothetical protein
VVKYEFGKCRNKVIMTPAWQVKTASDVATGRDFKKKQIAKS